jgi:hypothetical protein
VVLERYHAMVLEVFLGVVGVCFGGVLGGREVVGGTWEGTWG